MFKKIKIILILASLSTSLCLMSNTYSRYVADTTGNIDMIFAKWQILINNNDITSNASSSMNLVPVFYENANTAANVIAPSSKGYFDIQIDPSNVDVSFSYSIVLSMNNNSLPDFMMTKYSIIPKSYIEGNNLVVYNLINNKIENNLFLNKNIASFKFEPFTVRIYFEWYDGEGELMDDEDDTAIGSSTNNVDLGINATIHFEQIIE